MARAKPIRLLAAVPGDPLSLRTQSGVARRFVDALDRRYDVVDRIDTSLRPAQHAAASLLTARPNREEWRRHMHRSLAATVMRTHNLMRGVRRYDADFDLVVQVRSSYLPVELPFVAYLDNTMHTAKTHWPGGAAWRPRLLRQKLERERRALSRARHIFVTGRLVAESLTDYYRIPSERVSVVGGGCNFDPLPEPPAGVRPQRALFVGYDFARKGGPELLDAFRSLRRDMPDAELVVVGSNGSDEPGIRFAGRITDREELSRQFESARVFALPARYEPFGMVFLEAMAFGLPCVSTTVGAVPEIIDDGQTGIMVPPGDRTALAEALSALLGDGDRAAAMGRSARAKLERQYTWDAVVSRMAPALESLAE